MKKEKCNIFLSRNENYKKSAEKIRDILKITMNIIWIEDFMLEENKSEKLKNSIIYFLCNSPLVRELVKLLKETDCYIFNKSFYEKNYTKLEMQKKLIENNIKTPQIFEKFEIEKSKLPIFCKENAHAGMVFKIYTLNTINKFFEKFDSKEFYLEESIESIEEIKFYYVNGNIYSKNNIEIKQDIKNICLKISLALNLEVFSVDMMQKNTNYYVFDVNPAAGFYMLDEARNKLVYEIEKRGEKSEDINCRRSRFYW